MTKIFIIGLCLIIVSVLTGCNTQTPPPTASYFGYDNGTLSYNGTIEVNNMFVTEDLYEDLRFPASIIKLKGVTNIPEETKFSYAFDADDAEELFITAQTSHSRENGSDMFGHFHWSTKDDSAGDVVWCMSYQWANINEDFEAFETKCVVDSSVNNQFTHLMSPQIFLNGTGKEYSSILNAKIFRNATDSRDTYNNDAYLYEFDIHYKINKLGDW